MRYLRQSTAAVIEVGPFVDDTDGKTLEEALTVASIDVQLMQPLDTAAVPPDRVANGTFASDVSWTKGTGWDINSSTAGKAHHATGTGSDLEQTPAIALVENVAYELVFVISGISASNVTPKIGGTSGTARSTNATFTETIIAGSGSLIEFTATSTFVGDLDDVVFKQVPIPITPAASGSANDMVLVRANTGTYWLELTVNQVAIAGRHKLTAFISGALIVWEEFMVLTQEVFDDLFGASAVGYLKPTVAGRDFDVNAAGEAGLDLNNTSGTIVAAQIATDAITAAKLAADAGVEIAAAVWDRVLTGATHNIATSAGRRLRGIQEFQGYANGAIWIDTINGTTGTTDFENGTVENPVDSIADANTLAASLGIARFEVSPGSSITFAAAQAGQVFNGKSWTLALGGQNIAGSSFFGATVSGIGAGTGTRQDFVNCHLNACSHIKGTHLLECHLAGTQTVAEAGNYFIDASYSAVAGSGTPVWDFGAALNSSDVNFRHYSGGIEIQNMGAGTGSYQMSLEGDGLLIINANCSATSDVAIRGHFTITDNAGGAVTLSDAARFAEDQSIATVTGNVDGSVGSVVGAVGSVTGAVGSVIGNVGGDVQGNVDGSVGSVTGAVGSVTGAVGSVAGNVDGSVATIGAGGVIDGAIAAAELINIADAFLDRRLDLGADTGGNTTTSRTVRQSLRTMRNRVVIAGGVMTVYEEDDTTVDFTAVVTTTAGDPITELNPS